MVPWFFTTGEFFKRLFLLCLRSRTASTIGFRYWKLSKQVQSMNNAFLFLFYVFKETLCSRITRLARFYRKNTTCILIVLTSSTSFRSSSRRNILSRPLQISEKKILSLFKKFWKITTSFKDRNYFARMGKKSLNFCILGLVSDCNY